MAKGCAAERGMLRGCRPPLDSQRRLSSLRTSLRSIQMVERNRHCSTRKAGRTGNLTGPRSFVVRRGEDRGSKVGDRQFTFQAAMKEDNDDSSRGGVRFVLKTNKQPVAFPLPLFFFPLRGFPFSSRQKGIGEKEEEGVVS